MANVSLSDIVFEGGWNIFDNNFHREVSIVCARAGFNQKRGSPSNFRSMDTKRLFESVSWQLGEGSLQDIN